MFLYILKCDYFCECILKKEGKYGKQNAENCR